MAENYPNQVVRSGIGTYASPATLTGSYNDNKAELTSGGMPQLTVYAAYTPAESGRTFSLLVEGSPDGVVFYPVSAQADNSPFDGTVDTQDFVKEIVSTGTSEVRRRYLYPLADKYTRVSCKEDGANFGTINISYTLSGL